MWLTAPECTKQKKNLSIHTVINRHNELQRKTIESTVPFSSWKIEITASCRLFTSRLRSPAPFRYKRVRAENNKWIYNEVKKYPPSWLFSSFFSLFYWHRSMVLCEFIHRYVFGAVRLAFRMHYNLISGSNEKTPRTHTLSTPMKWRAFSIHTFWSNKRRTTKTMRKKREENTEIRTPSASIRARARVRDNERAESNDMDMAQRVQSHTIGPHSSWAVN